MKEHLLHYIENSKQRLAGLQEELDRATRQEDYYLAAEIKGMLTEMINSTYRLERIAEGKPAFEEPMNEVSK